MIMSFLLFMVGWWLMDSFLEGEKVKARRHRELMERNKR